MSGSVAARDEIPVIFIRKCFHRTHKSHMPVASDSSCTCKFKMADETGSSYKLVTGRYVSVMSTATTQFPGMPDPLPLVPTSSNFGEQHQVQTGSRNCTPNRKY